jgi:hypothetical protein
VPVPYARAARRCRDVLAGRAGLQDGQLSASARFGGRGPCHPDDLPEGYQPGQGPQAWQVLSRFGWRVRPLTGLIGLRQVDGMALEQVWSRA